MGIRQVCGRASRTHSVCHHYRKAPPGGSIHREGAEMGSDHPCMKPLIHCTSQSPVSLKALQFILFLFCNRASRIIRSGSIIATRLDLSEAAILPLLLSAALHTAVLVTGIAVPTRIGRAAVICALLQVLVLHAFALLLVTEALHRYTTSAGFLSVLLASHLCCAVRPINPGLVQAQDLLYGRVMDIAMFVLPVMSWNLLPILRVQALEAITLLYVPEVLCTVFAYAIRFATLLLQVAVATGCSMVGIGSVNTI